MCGVTHKQIVKSQPIPIIKRPVRNIFASFAIPVA